MADIQPPLPTAVEVFDQDDRISFSKLDNKYLAVHDDGTEYEFDAASRRWVLAEDEPLEPHEAHHLLVGDLARDDDDDASSSTSRKRKGAPSYGNERGGHAQDYDSTASKKTSRPAKKARQPPQPRQNTAVYVTGLPPDATADEVHELFSRKAGVVAEEIDSGRPRIKMYADAEGRFKGDALVVFFKPQSVEMAIMLLDDTDFRFSSAGLGSGHMRVQAADASYKKTRYDGDADSKGEGEGEGEGAAKSKGRGVGGGSGSGRGNGNGNGNGNGSGSGSGADRDRDRKRIIRKTQKLDAKLADWSDDEPSTAPAPGANKSDKVVILKHMFTLAELEEDPAALLDIKEDVREECAKLGAITNVVLFDEEPDGIVSVKFREIESALACVQLMNGRSFDGRTVEASISTGRERFKQSKKGADHSDSDDN